jgi:regulatory protein
MQQSERMRTITALTAQKRNQERVNVFLDGQYAFSLPLITAVSLKIGQPLSPDEIERLQAEDLFEKAKASAVRLLTYRPRSVAEIERHLRSKGYDDLLIAQVVEQLQTADLLDDEAFGRYWREQRETFKPRSSRALRQELQQKGMERALIDEVLMDMDETAAARQAALKQAQRWAGLPETEFRLKLGRFLQRRGFDYETIREVTAEMWRTVATDT